MLVKIPDVILTSGSSVLQYPLSEIRCFMKVSLITFQRVQLGLR